MRSPFKFPRRVRIHGGECDAVARALHHEAQKVALTQNEQTLISDEKAFLRQADLKRAFRSTHFERKQMSTKTSIKRIALVAVSALGFGLLSVVPAKAAAQVPVTTVSVACEYADGGAQAADSTTCYGAAGIANRVTLGSQADAAKNTLIVIDGAGALITAVANGTLGGTVATDGKSIQVAAGTVANTEFYVSTPQVGTITAKSYLETAAGSGIYSQTVVGTVTITVNASGLSSVLSPTLSTSVLTSDTAAAYGEAVAGTDDSVVAANTSGAAVGTILVDLRDGLNAPLNGATVSAVMSGAGLVSVGLTTAAATYAASAKDDASVTTATGAGSKAAGTADDGIAYVVVYGDGTSGVGTVTIRVNGTAWKTHTVTFYGALATLSATPSLKVFGADVTAAANGGAADDVYGVLLSGKDSNGVAVPLSAGTVTVVSADTNQVESATAQGTVSNDTGMTKMLLVTVDMDTTNAVAGKSTVVTYTIGTISATASITYGKNAAAAGSQVVTMTTDKSSYTPGEKMTITVTGKDSSGNFLGDGAQALFTAPVTANVVITGNLPVASPVLSNGVATYTAYAPLAAGDIVLSATANDAAASAVTTKFTVSGGPAADAANAAADAALEAIDAATAATDAANLAAEAADAATMAAQDAKDAADAATAAVEKLAQDVAAMIDALKAQLATLANVVAKIAKKVKA